MMKLEDFKDVEDTIEQRNSVLRAMKDCEKSLGTDVKDYWCYLSKYSDGSGKMVDMVGCKVHYEVLEAVEEILFKKLVEVNDKLKCLGVDISKEV